MQKAVESSAPETPSGTPPEVLSRPASPPAVLPEEIGGPKGPEPTRFGDWERNGRCIDF
jgi:hypothetical protein